MWLELEAVEGHGLSQGQAGPTAEPAVQIRETGEEEGCRHHVTLCGQCSVIGEDRT